MNKFSVSTFFAADLISKKTLEKGITFATFFFQSLFFQKIQKDSKKKFKRFFGEEIKK